MLRTVGLKLTWEYYATSASDRRSGMLRAMARGADPARDGELWASISREEAPVPIEMTSPSLNPA